MDTYQHSPTLNKLMSNSAEYTPSVTNSAKYPHFSWKKAVFDIPSYLLLNMIRLRAQHNYRLQKLDLQQICPGEHWWWREQNDGIWMRSYLLGWLRLHNVSPLDLRCHPEQTLLAYLFSCPWILIRLDAETWTNVIKIITNINITGSEVTSY